MEKKIISLFEIFLIVFFSFAFAYIIDETNSPLGRVPASESKGIRYLRLAILAWLSKGMVSAQEVLYTCLEDINGSICQEYSSSTCDGQCTTSCIPTTRENTVECQLGTCYDSNVGLCTGGAPKFACENSGGQWSENLPAECNLNCCLINPDGTGRGDQAQYTTEQQCNYLSQESGALVEWIPVNDELECLSRTNSLAKGACVLEFLSDEQKYNCEFTDQGSCLASGGEFYEGQLCTNPDLNTICEITQQTTCSEADDKVYFLDSCGNKANIYDASKISPGDYWNSVISRNESCSLGNSVDNFANQDSCGNCEYLLGSTCGEPGVGDVSPTYGNFVCKNLECIDEWGNERKNGESWCAFDGQIGVDGGNNINLNGTANPACQNATLVAESSELQTFCNRNFGSSQARSVDTPGSRNYRRICFDGEVRTEACADFRNEVCVQNTNENLDFTSASCRINPWQTCLAANGDVEDLNKCEKNSACFLKKVDVDDGFKFDMCVPKYPPGFDLKNPTSRSVAENFCSFASQSCTYIEEKKLSGWKCVVNCDCKKPEFAEQMNNLCISIGDCGGQVNYVGKYTDDGYSVSSRGKKVSSSYIEGLSQYAETSEGQSADALTGEEIAAIFGVDPATFDVSQVGSILGKIGLGALGATAAYGALGASSDVLGPFGSAALGAAAGASIAFILGSLFGLQGEGLTIAVIAGAVVGAVIGYLAFETSVLGTNTTFAAALGATFLWAAIAVLVIVVIISVLGIGKTRERKVEFSCLPWQPPTGGADCELCNSDEFGCSAYKCESLGQNCEFLNEGTGEEVCVDVTPNDSNAPIIDVLESAIGENLTYFNSQPNVGTEIEINEGDGCIKEYQPVQFGILLDEPGQCKISTEHTSSYGDMQEFFGSPPSSFYSYNHSMVLAVPTLDSLGVSGVNPARRGTYNAYVRCQDSSGNSNVAEYSINFCVRPADDFTAPTINKFVPESPGFSGLNASDFILQFYTNEPATCRWSLQDEDYGLMDENVVCQNGIEQVTLNGWLCQTNLDVSGNETMNYYLRCADQPWLGQNSTGIDPDRNVNTQSILYQIQKTTNPLEIEIIEPENGTTISVQSGSAVIDLEIHTLGGLNNNALCEFSLNGGLSVGFLNTGGQSHTQNDLHFQEGNHEITYTCQDMAGNIATATETFNVEIDDVGPVITRVYYNSAGLTVVTNEQSQCAYDTQSCGFTFEDGTPMSGFGYLHTTTFDPGFIYRVKCQDGFGNAGQCLTVTGGY